MRPTGAHARGLARRRLGLLLPGALALGLVACKRTAPAALQDAAPAASASAASTRDLPPPPPRCRPVESGVAVTDRAPPVDLEVGEAAAVQNGFAVGLLRSIAGVQVGTVARLANDVRQATFVDLGPPYGDAPAPKPFVRGETLFAAFYGRAHDPAGDAGALRPIDGDRELLLFQIATLRPALVGVVAQELDDSFAFDLAMTEKGGIVAWDEDGVVPARPSVPPPAIHGIVKVTVLSPDAKPQGTARVVSAETSDAELPRLAVRRGGYWLAYLAHAPEPSPIAPPGAGVADVGQELEGPGADRSFGWVEIVALDDHGAPLGPARRLTSDKGHVSEFALAPRSDSDACDIVARDDGESADGAGGRIVRAEARLDGADPPVAIVSEAVGTAGLELVRQGGGGALLFFGDTQDRIRAVPLGASMVPVAAASIEDALDRGRPLVAASGASVLAAFPGDPEKVLSLLTCDAR